MTFLLFKTVFDLNWFGRPNIYQEHLREDKNTIHENMR
jgi:hypothetical protein